MVSTKSDTLYLKLGKDEFSDYLDSNINFDGLRIASVNGKQFLLYEPQLDIVKSETGEFSMTIKSKARGKDPEKAQNYAREINYKYELQDSLITFQPWFMLPDKSVWRQQEIEITLKVPENKTIYLSNEMVKILHDIQNTSDMWDGDMGGKYWTMKPEGLELAQRKQLPVVSPKKNQEMNSIYRIGVMAALIFTTLVGSAQSRSYQIYDQYAHREGFTSLAFSKAMIDAVNLNIDEENKKITGDLMEIRILFSNREKNKNCRITLWHHLR